MVAESRLSGPGAVPESTRSVALLGTAGRLLRLINAARLFPQGPSRQLPRHRGAACVTELWLHRLRMELIGEMYSTETDATQSEIEHCLKLNTRVPSEFDDKPLAF